MSGSLNNKLRSVLLIPSSKLKRATFWIHSKLRKLGSSGKRRKRKRGRSWWMKFKTSSISGTCSKKGLELSIKVFYPLSKGSSNIKSKLSKEISHRQLHLSQLCNRERRVFLRVLVFKGKVEKMIDQQQQLWGQQLEYPIYKLKQLEMMLDL